MTKPLPLTKAAIKRAIAAAVEQGCKMIEVTPDGTIRVILRSEIELAALPKTEHTSGDGWDASA